MNSDSIGISRGGRVGPGRTRRQLLTGAAAGAAGAIAAQTLLGGAPAYAGTDGDVVLGQANTETAATSISNTTSGDDGLDVVATGNGIGVSGLSDSGAGVFGQSDTGVGVAGVGGANGVVGSSAGPGANGVRGDTDAPNSNGVFGYAQNADGSGVYGQNDDTGFGVAGRAHRGTGVLGDSWYGTAMSAHTLTGTALQVAAVDTGSRGVYSTDGGSGDGPALVAHLTYSANPSPAILAETAGTGPALSAQVSNPASGSPALSATTTGTGPAVYAHSATGVALHVAGKAIFSRSGLATVKAGSRTVTVHLAGVSSTSLILATPHQAVGTIAVAAAVPDDGSFAIHLTTAPASDLQVAYLVLG